MSQPLTALIFNSLRAAGQILAKGQCPFCDGTGLIDHTRCDNCLNGQADGATCASCHGQPLTPVTPTHCPHCNPHLQTQHVQYP